MIEESAARYEEQVPSNDPFFISWGEFQDQIAEREMVSVSASDQSAADFQSAESWQTEGDNPAEKSELPTGSRQHALEFQSLEVFRPIGNRPPEPQIAEAQRKEFFSQIHRW